MASKSCLLAVLSPDVAVCPAANAGGCRGEEVLGMFGAGHAGSISVSFDDAAALRYHGGHYNRQLASFDNIFCVFMGSLDNLGKLRQAYGLSKSRMNEPTLVIEMYKALRDRAPFPVPTALSELRGGFAFLLYDNVNKSCLVAMDGQGRVPLFWGTCQDGTLALSDDVDVLRRGCSTSFAPFPAGCYFTTASGLKSFEHPASVLRPVPYVDSISGTTCGSSFEVDQLQDLTAL